MDMKDARQLSPDAQEALRKRVIIAIRTERMSVTAAARTFGVSRAAIYKWLKVVSHGGMKMLDARRRGRPGGISLLPHEAATIVRIVQDRCPDQLKFPFALWTREAVKELIQWRYGVSLSIWTVGRYLKRWGFTPQKPIRRAYEKDREKVEAWLREEYPAIRVEAKRLGAVIHWGDQMGLRSDHQTGTSYGKRGRTPVIGGSGKRFGCNMISSVTNLGQMAFMVFKGRFSAKVMINFMRRLLRLCGRRRVFLILDQHPVHRSSVVTQWVKTRKARLSVFYLPPYSPELNPDEYLNQDVKSNALGRNRPMTQEEMMSDLRSYLWATQRCPDIVRNYFQADHVRYAAL